jgi:hypothetical protein
MVIGIIFEHSWQFFRRMQFHFFSLSVMTEYDYSVHSNWEVIRFHFEWSLDW